MIELHNLTKRFDTPSGSVEALRNVSLRIRPDYARLVKAYQSAEVKAFVEQKYQKAVAISR